MRGEGAFTQDDGLWATLLSLLGIIFMYSCYKYTTV